MVTTSQAQHTSIGGYRIIGTLGTGGMGVVYVAEHELLGRKAAVKVLLPELSNDQEVVDRFFKEAKAATAIKHPGIVKVYDFGYQDDSSAYIAMEYLEGEALDVRLRRFKQLPVGHALRLAGQMASALAAAHGHGIVHRDLKPANVFIVPDPQVAGGERVKLLDFGIAKFAATDDPDAKQTRAGAILGSPQYMAPEQIRGAGEVDLRADLYSVGCMLFEMLCGRPPFDGGGNGPMAVMASHLDDPPPMPSSLRPELPREIDALILYLLAKEPAHRYQSAAELGVALAAISGEPVSFGSMSGATAQLSPVSSSMPSGVALNPSGAPLSASQILSQAAQTGTQAPPTTLPGAPPGQSQVRTASMQVPTGKRRLVAVLAAAVLVVGIAMLAVARMGEDQVVAAEETPAELEAEVADTAAVEAETREQVEERQRRTFRTVVRERGSGDEDGVIIEIVSDDALEAPDWSSSSFSFDRLVSGTLFKDIITTIRLTVAPPPPPPARVTWRVSSRPPRAEVVHNGEVIGTTPVVATMNMDPSVKVTYTLRKAGFDDATVELSGAESFERAVSLAPKIAVTVDSRPRGAEVLDAGGRSLGTAPAVVMLSRSEQPVALTLRLEGHEDRAVEIVPDRKKRERFELTRVRATITHRITSEPPGATVSRGKEEVGVTPFEASFLEGKGSLSYVLSLDGYQDRTVRLRADRSGDEVVRLRKCDDKPARRSRTDPVLGRPEIVNIYKDPC